MQLPFRNNVINNAYFLKMKNLFDSHKAFEELKKPVIFRVPENS